MESQQAIREMTISEKVIEGRRRMLTCLDNIGAQEESVDLLELQKDYLRTFGSYLNKDELRSYFCKTHIKQIFHVYMHKDVEMSTDINQTGSLFLKLKRPLQAALADPPFNRGNRNRIEPPHSKITERNPNLIPLPPNKVKTFIAAAPAPIAVYAAAVDNKMPPPKPVATPRARGKVDTGKQYGFDLLSSDEEQPPQPANGGGKPTKGKDSATEKEKYSWDESDCEEDADEAEEEEQEDTDDDKLLEANNDSISKENQLAKVEQPKAAAAGKPVVPIRKASHSDKYKREVLKMHEQEKKSQQQLTVAGHGWDDEEEIVDGTNNGMANDTNTNAKLDPEVEKLKQRCLQKLELKKQAMLLGGKDRTVQAITRALVEPHGVKKAPPPKAAKAVAAKLQMANLMSSDEGERDAESVNDEEEEEVIMSKELLAKAKLANKKTLAVAAFEKGFTDSMEAEDEGSIGLGTPSPQQNGSINFDQLPEAMRFEICGMVAVSVKLEGAVKPEIVHAKLGSNQEYSQLYSGVIKSAQDLVAFVQRFCLNAIHVQNLPSGPLLVYQEEPGKHYSIGYLLQKMGKTLMQKGGD